MCADIAVGHAASHVNDTFVNVVATLVELAALADQFHNPHLVGVGNGERFATRCVAVLLSERNDYVDSLACGLCALQGDVDQRAVVHNAGRVLQFGATAKCGFGDDERVLVHIADGRIGALDLLDLTHISAAIPIIYRHIRAFGITLFGSVVLVECTIKLMRIGSIADDDRSVGRCAARHDQVCAGHCHARGEQSDCGE